MNTHTFDQTMIGAYKLERVISEQRLHTRYLASEPLAEQSVILTAFMLSLQLSARVRYRFLSRFTQEISILATLQHPAILPVTDYGEHEGIPFKVAPATSTTSLSSLLQQKTRWTFEEVVAVLKQISAALDYAHTRGVVHGCLQPEYIHFSEDKKVLIADFGVNRLLESDGMDESEQTWAHLMSVVGTYMGSLEYTAPECIQGEPASRFSDIYSLGCMLFTFLNGTPPFAGTPLDMLSEQVQTPVPSLQKRYPDLLPELLAQIDRVLLKALAYRPEQRWQTAGAFAAAFEQACKLYPNRTRLPLEISDSVQIVQRASIAPATKDKQELKTLDRLERIIVDESSPSPFQQPERFKNTEPVDPHEDATHYSKETGQGISLPLEEQDFSETPWLL